MEDINNMKDMLVSVIIPVYKAEKYLARCIESVIGQSYPKLEIILVDDGSPDSCPSICDNYEKQDKRVVVIHKKNGGLSSARNAGIKIAKGKYLFFLDADDFINYNALKEMVYEAEKNQSEIVVAGLEKVSEDVEKFVENQILQVKFIKIDNTVFFEQKISNHSCGKLFQKALFDHISFPEGRNYEDVATSYLIFDKATNISYTKVGLYYYRITPNGISNTFSKKNLDDFMQAYNEIDEFVKCRVQDKINDEYCEKLYYYQLTILYTIYSRLCRVKSAEDNLNKIKKVIRKEFNEKYKNVKLNKHEKSIMTLKIFLYRYYIMETVMYVYFKVLRHS